MMFVPFITAVEVFKLALAAVLGVVAGIILLYLAFIALVLMAMAVQEYLL